MKTVLLLLALMATPAQAHLAHFMTPTVTDATTIDWQDFALTAGATPCVFTDGALHTFNPNTTTPTANSPALGNAVCRMTGVASRWILAAGCSVNATTNTIVCTGDVDPASCHALSAGATQSTCP